MYPFKWKSASSFKTNCPTHEHFLKNHVDYRITVKTRKFDKSVNMSCKTRQNFEVSIAGGSEEEGKEQLLIQSNSREMVNILGGYGIGRERKEFIRTCF
jgi:hypothetical protein